MKNELEICLRRELFSGYENSASTYLANFFLTISPFFYPFLALFIISDLLFLVPANFLAKRKLS